MTEIKRSQAELREFFRSKVKELIHDFNESDLKEYNNFYVWGNCVEKVLNGPGYIRDKTTGLQCVGIFKNNFLEGHGVSLYKKKGKPRISVRIGNSSSGEFHGKIICVRSSGVYDEVWEHHKRISKNPREKDTF